MPSARVHHSAKHLKLLRCVATVEVNGKLQVSVKAWKVDDSGKNKDKISMPKEADDISVEKEAVFTPKKLAEAMIRLTLASAK